MWWLCCKFVQFQVVFFTLKTFFLTDYEIVNEAFFVLCLVLNSFTWSYIIVCRMYSELIKIKCDSYFSDEFYLFRDYLRQRTGLNIIWVQTYLILFSCKFNFFNKLPIVCMDLMGVSLGIFVVFLHYPLPNWSYLKWYLKTFWYCT